MLNCRRGGAGSRSHSADSRPSLRSVDATRTNEVVGKVNETLVPQLRKLPGFAGYYLIEAGCGVLSSLGLFETSDQADASTSLVKKWIADEHFSTVIPSDPKITSGKVVAHSDGVTVS